MVCTCININIEKARQTFITKICVFPCVFLHFGVEMSLDKSLRSKSFNLSTKMEKNVVINSQTISLTYKENHVNRNNDKEIPISLHSTVIKQSIRLSS